MSERWATIITNDDGQEVISNIAQMEGSPPDVRKGNAKVQKVGEGVKVGMVKGGSREAADGWGFPGDDVAVEAKEKAADKPKKGGRPKKADAASEPEADQAGETAE